MEKNSFQVTPLFLRNLEASKPVVINVGGARSGKSYAIHQIFLLKLISEGNYNLLICRKTFPALRMSNIYPFLEMLKDNFKGWFKYSKKDCVIIMGANRLYFRSIDKIDKMKSTEFNYIFMEEANEMSYEDYQILKMRLSRKNNFGKNQLFMAFNPVPCWIWDKLIHNPFMKNEIEVIFSYYNNNYFLSDDYIQILENLKNQNETLYKIYALGEYAEFNEAIIYNNWKIVDDINWNGMEDIVYGLDFGYNNPTAMVKVGIKENNIYVEEVIYQSKLTNQDLIRQLFNLDRYDIYADSAEPNRIEEIYREGFNIYPSIKDVKYGIDILKSKNIFIHRNSEHIINEIKTYSFARDKEGKIIEEPIKYNDHCLDALRYAVTTRIKNYIGQVRICRL